MSLGLQGALNALAGTSGLAEQGAAAALEARMASFLPQSKAWCWASAMDTSNGAAAYSTSSFVAAGARIPCFLMDPVALEGAYATIALPQWDRFDLFVRWGVPTATAGDVVWQSQYQLLGAGVTAAAEVNGPQTTATAGALDVITDTRVLSGITRGTADHLKIDMLRRGDVAADTLAADVGLIGLYVVKAA